MDGVIAPCLRHPDAPECVTMARVTHEHRNLAARAMPSEATIAKFGGSPIPG